MRDGKQAENILTSLAQLAEDAANKNMSIFGEAAATRPNKVLGRQKSVHHTLGGGKSADVLLWRNKKVSAGVLSSATAVWILFEWLNYNFLTLLCFALILGMLGQFMWSNASGYLRISIAMSVGKEANKVLGYLQDISCGGNLKQLLLVIVSLLAASVIGTWCNFLL